MNKLYNAARGLFIKADEKVSKYAQIALDKDAENQREAIKPINHGETIIDKCLSIFIKCDGTDKCICNKCIKD